MKPRQGTSNERDAASRVLQHRWPLVLGIWFVPAVLSAFETYIFWRMSGRDYPLWRAMVMEGPAWLTYALFTPVIFALGRLLPLQRPRLWRHLVVHLAAAVSGGAIYSATATATTIWFSPAPVTMPFARMATSWFLSALPLTTLTYFGILGVAAAVSYFIKAKEQETEAARLSAQLAEARLGALRMQLHPHFLFNTLNAMTVLSRDGDSAAVTRMLMLLSDLLRDVLRTDAAHHVPISEEVAFARRYLDIELVRFAERLCVVESIDSGVRDVCVPVFLLQPLLENALRHGIAPRAVGGTVELGARRVNGDVELWVRDNGIGLPERWEGAGGYGIGLSNVAARLTALYGARAALSVGRVPTGGTNAVVRIPADGTRIAVAG